LLWDDAGEPLVHQQTGNRSEQGTTLYDIAGIHWRHRMRRKAEKLLARVVALDEAIEDPQLEEHRALLRQVQAMLDRS
jgi:ribosome biogenesis GTPase A